MNMTDTPGRAAHHVATHAAPADKEPLTEFDVDRAIACNRADYDSMAWCDHYALAQELADAQADANRPLYGPGKWLAGAIIVAIAIGAIALAWQVNPVWLP